MRTFVAPVLAGGVILTAILSGTLALARPHKRAKPAPVVAPAPAPEPVQEAPSVPAATSAPPPSSTPAPVVEALPPKPARSSVDVDALVTE